MPIDLNAYDQSDVIRIDLAESDNWMHVVRAEHLLGRRVTAEERADLLAHGSNAACVRAFKPG